VPIVATVNDQDDREEGRVWRRWRQEDQALENVQPEMIPGMVTLSCGVKIDPILIERRNPHLRRIPMVQIRRALKIFRRVKIVWIIHVRIVIEPLPILCIDSSPLLTKSLLRRCSTGQQEQTKRAKNSECDCAEHKSKPFQGQCCKYSVSGATTSCLRYRQSFYLT
jgi:hypothetical protein